MSALAKILEEAGNSDPAALLTRLAEENHNAHKRLRQNLRRSAIILLVCSDGETARDLRERLIESGIAGSVQVASTREEAHALLDQHRFDLIFADIEFVSLSADSNVQQPIYTLHAANALS